MNIKKTNYGAWFIDYFDGTLSVEKTAELFLFLEQYPDLKSEFESYRPVILEPAAASFENKDLLRKNAITSENIGQYIIAELENDLNPEDKISLENFIAAHPSFEKDRKLFSLARLKPGDELFPDKKSLRKKVIRQLTVRFNVWTAVAAAVLIILGVLYINRPEEKKGTAEISPVKNNTVNDSLKDFFKSADDVNAEIKNEKTAEANDTAPKEFQKKIQLHPTERKNYAYREKRLMEDAIPAVPVPLAERKGINTFTVVFNSDPVETSSLAYLPLNNSPEKKETLQDKIADLKDKAAEKINAVTGEEILYSTTTIEDPLAEKMPFKSRMLKFAAWAVSRLSNDKIKMETTFDQSGNVAAYQVSAGKLKYEKDF
jgi:hypothetical protein